jgi:hypothetical protein
MKRPVELCPFCKADLIGEPIPKNMWDNYNPPYYWKRKIAIYSLELDRTVRWKCPDCHGEWERGGNER